MAGQDAVLGRPSAHSSDSDPHPDSVYIAFWRAAPSRFGGTMGPWRGSGFCGAPGVARLRDRFTVDASDAMASDVGSDSACLRGRLWECSLVVGVADVALVASRGGRLGARSGNRLFVGQFL